METPGNKSCRMVARFYLRLPPLFFGGEAAQVRPMLRHQTRLDDSVARLLPKGFRGFRRLSTSLVGHPTPLARVPLARRLLRTLTHHGHQPLGSRHPLEPDSSCGLASAARRLRSPPFAAWTFRRLPSGPAVKTSPGPVATETTPRRDGPPPTGRSAYRIRRFGRH
jgi:hypothetical protein